MNFSVYIDNNLYNELQEFSKDMHVTRNSIIKSALADWIARHRQGRWHKLLRECQVGEDFPDIEELREGLLPPRKVDL